VPDVPEILGVDEQPNAAEPAFDEAAEQDVVLAVRAIRIVLEPRIWLTDF